MDADARRGRTLIEESREAVVVLDDADTVLLASRRARQSIDGIREDEPIPEGLLSGDLGIVPLIVPYEVGGRRERLVYLSQVGDMTAYEELRTGFTAAVSHELRTPLARLLALLETATLPGEDVHALVDRARREVESVRELIDEVLFLSELESGGRVVSLGPVAVRPELDAAVAELEDRASRAGVAVVVEGSTAIELEMRPRMLRVIAQNLAENAIRYAGPGATFTLADRARRGRIDRAARHRRRCRRQRGGALAPVRALLPGRSRARLARHRPRPRDRQAHRRAGRRHGRSARWQGRRARDPLHLPAEDLIAAHVRSPVSHHSFTIRHPTPARADTDTARGLIDVTSRHTSTVASSGSAGLPDC